ncbi:MAG: NAD(P)-binding domain-containing protein, partial [Firmicutes bacterium]|nr:NAD(P)-binding domain-containing protein [Bacillota bacterium]
MDKIGVIGAGSWGTALAQTLAGKGYEVFIYDVNKEHLDEMKENRENVRYLPGVPFSDNLHIVYSAEEALTGAKLALFSAPAQFFRSAAENAVKYLTSDTLIVNVAKGIEQKSLKRMSEIAEEVFTPVLGTYKYVVLSGPSHAEEVSRGLPTTNVVAAKNIKTAQFIQDTIMSPYF